MLSNDPEFLAITQSGVMFERWIKLGSEGFPAMTADTAGPSRAAGLRGVDGVPVQGGTTLQQVERILFDGFLQLPGDENHSGAMETL